MTAVQNTSEEALRELVNNVLELLPEEVQQFLYMSAVPNAFTPTLIERMSGGVIDVAGSLEKIGELSFLHVGQGTWKYLDTDVRNLLNEHWRDPALQGKLLAAHQAAITYFEELASRSPAPGNHTFQREVLYHRLLRDEQDGLSYLAQAFETTVEQYAYGQAQAYQEKLQILLPQLSSTATDHNAYYQARLDFIHRRLDGLESRMQELIDRTSDRLLKPRAGVLLAQVWSSQYKWKQAVEIMRASLHDLQKSGITTHAARTMLALGDVYVGIARYSGGWQDDFSFRSEGANRLLYFLVFLPYRLLDWLRRKLFFFPSLFYFNGDYQDWILNYLFRVGGGWYRNALRAAQRTGDQTTILEATFKQAELALNQRREIRAERAYSKLADLDAVRSSRYRTAQVAYGQGQVRLLAGNLEGAREKLLQSLQIFREYEDERRIADVTCTLGETELRARQYEDSAHAFIESIRSYNLQNDTLAQTQSWLKLQDVAASNPLTPELQAQVSQARDLTPEHHYLARFPSILLDRFRSLAFRVAFPLSYAITLVVGLAAGASILVIESLRLQTTGVVTPSEVLLLAFIAIMPLPLSLWTMELVYCFVGQLWLLTLARRSLDSLGEEPDRLIVARETITYFHSNHVVQRSWQDFKTLISENYSLWRRPISLFSRQILVADNGSIILEGITNAYSKLSAEVHQKVSNTASRLKADTVILANRWTFLTLLAAWLHAVLLYNVGQLVLTARIRTTCETVPLFWAILFLFTIINWLIIFPPVVLWKVYRNRRISQDMSGTQSTSQSNASIFRRALVLTIIAVIWLVVTPFLDTGDKSNPTPCTPQPAALGQAGALDRTGYLNLEQQSAAEFTTPVTTVSASHGEAAYRSSQSFARAGQQHRSMFH